MHSIKSDVWYANEREGRLISSLVSWTVVGLMLAYPTWIAVLLMGSSVSFDLIRSAYRNHLLHASIVVHHLVTLVLCVLYIAEYQTHNLMTRGTQCLLMMELTNPFLHGAWYFGQDPSQMTHSQSPIYARRLLTVAFLLWPWVRIVTSVVFLICVVQGLDGYPAWAIGSLGLSLSILQAVWFVKMIPKVCSHRAPLSKCCRRKEA